jgi:hypothetical protein
MGVMSWIMSEGGIIGDVILSPPVVLARLLGKSMSRLVTNRLLDTLSRICFIHQSAY